MNNTFLLADDDSDDANIFYEVLSKVDPSAIFLRAWDGKEALQLLEKSIEKPNIIFLDINMPGMNGWECLATLKSSETYKSIPVIMYSTSAHKRERELAFKLGAHCLIEKPDDMNCLQMILETIIININDNLMEALKNLTRNKDLKCFIESENWIINTKD
jgi:CheY-like chemotaxis protein